MAQFNIDIDSDIIRISQLIYGICPGMSQATLFSRVFVVPALVREGLVPSEIGAAQFNTEQTGYCKTIPRPFSTQTDGTVSFCFKVQLLLYALSAAIHLNRSRAWTYCCYIASNLGTHALAIRRLAQFNTDVDSGTITISQFIDRLRAHRSC